jgi:dihydropteroate synthase
VNPYAVETLAAHGIAWEGRTPKTVDEVAGQRFDLVITVCDHARDACPFFPGATAQVHWGLPDPADAATPEAARDHALRLAAAGADILDIGGESTRPGATPVTETEELERVMQLITAIRARASVAISIDTMKPVVARAAVAAGASIWNDVTALRHAPDSLDTAAALGCQVVLMHMQGQPGTMQAEPRYDDVVADVIAFLAARAEAAVAAGVARDRIWLDPGIGFGKHPLDHNLPLLAGLERIVGLGFPVLLGASRKRFIGMLDGDATEEARLGGSIAAAASIQN